MYREVNVHSRQTTTGAARLDPVKPGRQAESAYGQILRSSFLMGGSSLLVVLISLIRIKGIALMAGPAGIGLWGIYLSIVDLVQILAGLGIFSSGLRQVAAVAGDGNPRNLARTVWVLRRAALILGGLGTVFLAVMAGPIARWTFGDESQAEPIMGLSLAILLRIMAEAQTSLLQGLRRVDELARMTIVVAVLNTFSSLAWIQARGVAGIVPALVTLAALNLLVSVWYGRSIRLPRVSVGPVRIRREITGLLGLGPAFLASGLMVMGTAYLIRLMILNRLDQQAVGLYQAAFALGWLYVSLVLQALGSDFYPRLTAVANDFAACNRMVNQQIRIGLLLAVPGVLATLLLAPGVIEIFYSQEFRASVELLRWLCLAMSFRVVSWPMMFILLAQGSRIHFFWSEAVFTLLCLGLTWLGLLQFGLNGAGMALFVAQLSHSLLMYAIVHRLCDFRLTGENLQLAGLGAGTVGLVFAGFHLVDETLAWGGGFVGLMASLFFVAHHLLDLIPPRLIPYPLVWLLTRQSCFVVYDRRAWRLGMLTVLGLWGFWYEEAYGWKSGFSHFVNFPGVTP